jgi:pilus assembly protein CpaD
MVVKLRTALLLAGVALALGGCLNRGDTTGSIPSDYRERHPITLVRANETLDVFVGRNAHGLDRRQSADVQAFGRQFMERGEGPIVAYLPQGGAPGVNRGLTDIRQALAAGGAGGRLQIAHYVPGDPTAAATIKLAFASLQARTPGPCGADNDEMAQSSTSQTWANRNAINFGCSYQQNLAAQINDPRDLVRPRQEGAVDTVKRINGIERLRDGEEPSTSGDLRGDGRVINRNVGPQ